MEKDLGFFMDFRYLLLLFFLWMNNAAIAQQLPSFLQNRDQQALLNPAALSNDYLIYNRSFGVKLASRNYGLGDELAPKTGALSMHTIIRQDQGVQLLLGANLLFDDEGFTQTLSPQLRVAGVFSTNPDREKIVVGLAGGLSQFAIKTEDVRLVEEGDSKGLTGLTQWYPNVNLGFFYSRWLQNDDNFYVGVSIPQLFALNKTLVNEQGTYQLERQAHYLARMGMHKFVGEDSFLEPSIRLLFLANAPVLFDANLRFKWGKFIWLGAGGSNNGYLTYELGVYGGKRGNRGSHLAIGLAMNSPAFSKVAKPFGNSFEINLTWSK